nr:hypothetical protein [Vibrio sp. 1180_3]
MAERYNAPLSGWINYY